MEIRDTGEHSHRRATIEDAQDALGASSMTAGVLAACEHADSDVKGKRRALRYLETHVEGQHVRKVADLLSTRHVPITYTASVAVGVEENEILVGTDE